MDNKEENVEEVSGEVRLATPEEIEAMGLLPISKKIFYLDNTINMEMFTRLVEFINAHADQSIIEIWMSSPGGDCMVTEMIRDLIEEYQMPIVGCYYLGSSAFNLFMTANTIKRLVTGTKGIFHRSYHDSIPMDDTFKPMIDSEFRRFMGESYRSVEETIAKVPLTPTQKRKFKKGDDINFTYAEMITLIKSFEDENFVVGNQAVTE